MTEVLLGDTAIRHAGTQYEHACPCDERCVIFVTAERDAARSTAKAALKYIIGQAGIPDPVEACRQIIATCNRTLAAFGAAEGNRP